MRKLLLFAVAALCLAPIHARAGGCDCGSVGAMILRAQTAINLNTTTEAEQIRTEITEAAQNIIGTIRLSSSSIVRAIVALQESNIATLKGLGAARMTQDTDDLYGRAAQPDALCGASTMGAGIQVGSQAATLLRKDLRSKQIERSNNAAARPLDHLQRQLSEEHPGVKAMVDAVFPLDRTMTEEQVAQAHEAVKTLADPRPLPMVADAQKDTAAGQIYAAARQVHQGRVQTAMEALNQHIALHAPTLPDDVASWAVDQWREAGASGTPPGIVNGRISEAALYHLMAQMRLANPNWYTRIAEETEAGLLREMALMMAAQLQLAARNLEHLDRISVISAIDYLSRMEGSTGRDMEELYRRMVGTQQ